MKKPMMKLGACLLILLSAGSLLAQGRQIEQNEDLVFIRQWQKTQKITELAGLLALSPEQISTLLDAKAAVDQVEADFEPQEQDLRDRLAVTAAEVRAVIEATDNLSEEDAEALKAFREEARSLRKEKRLNLQLATMGLDNFLTEEQKEILRQELGRNRPNREEGQAGEGQRGGGEGQAAGNRRESARKLRSKARVTRILLSDDFIAAIQ